MTYTITISTMTPLTLPQLFLLLAFLCTFLYYILNSNKHGRKLPPGPRALPIIGNLHLLGKLPHQSLYRLAKQYGSIMLLRLGTVTTIVVSSPEAAELFLKTHDVVFASRPKLQVDYLLNNHKGMIFGEYGPNWRAAKKLFTTEILNPLKIESFAPIRKTELDGLVETLRRATTIGEAVNLSDKLRELGENIGYKMILGRTKDERFNLKKLIEETVILLGEFNIADYVPWLGAFDLQGMVPRSKSIRRDLDKMFDIIIDEHEQELDQKQQKDFIDTLLSRTRQSQDKNNKEEFIGDRANMKALILDMIGAALDTSTTAQEWALAELLKHPEAKLKLQKELEDVIGMDKMVEEKDLTKLNYLDMVVKETFRLHPVAPLLPHESMEEITVDGYYIPKKSMIIVNTWAIGRDVAAWSGNFEEFIPERFCNSNVDYRGRHFQLLPFGAGRRRCPGLQLGELQVKYVIAQLMHCFDWELGDGMLPSELDMDEKFGLTLPRANNLFSKPTYRLLI